MREPNGLHLKLCLDASVRGRAWHLRERQATHNMGASACCFESHPVITGILGRLTGGPPAFALPKAPRDMYNAARCPVGTGSFAASGVLSFEEWP